MLHACGLNLCGAVHMFKTRPSMKTLLNTEKKKGHNKRSMQKLA